jgi:hypothetical protein
MNKSQDKVFGVVINSKFYPITTLKRDTLKNCNKRASQIQREFVTLV